MFSLRPLLLLILAVNMAWCSAQTVLPLSPEMQMAYRKDTRNKTGAPGKRYWQNTADYSIKLHFDPATRQLKGSIAIVYSNNSPDTLKRLLFKLYPNLYRRDAMRTMPVADADLGTGMHIDNMVIGDKLVDSTQLITRGTNLSARGVQVMPGSTIQVTVDYSYTLNEHSFIRTGQIDTGAFFIAYFFPRIAVYDDVDGWNEYAYTGHDEFYNDYGQYHVEITIPDNFLVWATGDLTNTDELYNPVFAKKIQDAGQTDTTTDIITKADLDAGNILLHKKFQTWKFVAGSVTDFAFALSNHYVWKSCSLVIDPVSGRRTRVDAVYNPDHTVYLPVISYARNTVKTMSYHFPHLPFPYAHETIFDGLDAMEYPMMVNNLPFTDKQQAVEFTTHEVFHTLFPFFVGTNETKHAFMDEGWATLSEFMLYASVDSGSSPQYDISDVNESAGTEQDVPVMTLSPQLYGKARYANKDLKPALGYFYIKELLGDRLFSKALNYYILQWQGKHPTPFDFFYCMNAASGVNLNWFWKNWFFEKNIPDLGITRVSQQQHHYTVTITRVGEGMVPIHLAIYNRKGQQIINRSIACWAKGNKTVQLNFDAEVPVNKIVLGSLYDADTDKTNNSWIAH